MRIFLTLVLYLSIAVASFSCGDSKEEKDNCTFNAPFPKTNKLLTKILGEKLIIKSGTDTLRFNISSNKERNLITYSENGDTAFIGTISKFRGLYYFSEPLNDSSFFIYTVKISDNLIYGFNTEFTQMCLVEQAIKNGFYRNLVNLINIDTTVIRLQPDKHELKKLYGSIISTFKPDTILNFNVSSFILNELTTDIKEQDNEDFNYISKLYPNPTSGIINIELQQKSKFKFDLSDINGKSILKGQLNEITTKIDISKQKAGFYILTLLKEPENQKETIKIVKSK